jgi:glycosyltransferase involved in cell wall biosynthesis
MVRVSVCVDLFRRPEAGGHVKCWERFAEAATQLPGQLELSVHFLGEDAGVRYLSDNVRYVTHLPVFSTQRLPFLHDVADHTDLASWHRRLAIQLLSSDVIHTTHSLFSFGKTGMRIAHQVGKPLVSSVHTDTPKYTRIFTEQIVHRSVKPKWMAKLLVNKLEIHHRREQTMRRQLARYWSKCDSVLVSQQDDFRDVIRNLPAHKVSALRRGIDKELFNPAARNRQRLLSRFNIPDDRFIILFVGRVDAAKNIQVYAQVVSALIKKGLPVHGLVVGRGASKETLRQQLGPNVTFTGVLRHCELSWIYASSDLFVFPSNTETYGNVVVEAKACGLPVLVAKEGGAAQLVIEGIDGHRLDHRQPQEWVAKIHELMGRPNRIRTMGQAARHHVETTWPSWLDVLEQDLLPVWQRLYAQHDSSNSKHYLANLSANSPLLAESSVINALNKN